MVKRIIQIQLLPTPDQAAALEETMCRFHQACNGVAQRAFERKLANRYALHKLYYYDVRQQFALPAQMACLTPRVRGGRPCYAWGQHPDGTDPPRTRGSAAAYQRDKSKQVSFRPLASMPYDARLLQYRGLDRVSLTTLAGCLVVPMVMGTYQAEQFGHVKRYAELVRRRDGKWFLMATVEFDDVPPVDPNDFLGVDLGVANLATDSDGHQHSGAAVRELPEAVGRRGG